MKYLIIEDFSGKQRPFIFPDSVDHVDMRGQLPYAKVISCGVVSLSEGGFVCTGGNSEMEIKARPSEDAELIWEVMKEPHSN